MILTNLPWRELILTPNEMDRAGENWVYYPGIQVNAKEGNQHFSNPYLFLVCVLIENFQSYRAKDYQTLFMDSK